MAIGEEQSTFINALSELGAISLDVGEWETANWTGVMKDSIISKGIPPMPKTFPRDSGDRQVTESIFVHSLANKEPIKRDWLTWSPSKEAFFCFPCLLFSKVDISSKPKLCRPGVGFSHRNHKQGWKKLLDRVKEHHNSEQHGQLTMDWKDRLRDLKNSTSVDSMLIRQRSAEVLKWRNILKRYIDCLLYLTRQRLALRGSDNTLIGESKGNFLALLELLAKYDPFLDNHLQEVKLANQEGKPIISYLSGTSQNQLLALCGDKVREEILKRRQQSKYYGLICDATPDKSRTEQTTVIIRYVHFDGNQWKVEESFLEFLDYNMKKGAQLAELYLSRLAHHKIPVQEMRAQGYDNGSNMAGIHKGVQAEILRVNHHALFSPCAAHSLNLSGVHAVRSTTGSQKYFRNLQRLYVLFSSSPSRWEILKKHLKISFKPQSETRWSERVDAIKPVAQQQPSVLSSLKELLDNYGSSLTVDAKATTKDLAKYFSTFESILHGTVWLKVMQAIQEVNLLLQHRGMSLERQVLLMDKLLQDLNKLRDSWSLLLQEAKHVANAMKIESSLVPIGGRPIRLTRNELSAEQTFEQTRDVLPILPIEDTAEEVQITSVEADEDSDETVADPFKEPDTARINDVVVNEETEQPTEVGQQGRPRRQAQVPSSINDDASSDVPAVLTTVPARRGRGRPPGKRAGRGRGRPPRSSVVVQTPHTPVPVSIRRGRGRPPNRRPSPLPTSDSSLEQSESEETDPEIELTRALREREVAESSFRVNCFNVVLDCLLSQIRTRFEDSKKILDRFSFLWDFSIDETLAKQSAIALQEVYKDDLSENFSKDISLLLRSKSIFLKANNLEVGPLELLNKIFQFEMSSILPEVCVALRIFLCLPVTVAEGERSFSSLSFLKNSLRTTMLQDRLNSLALIAIESEIAAQIDYEDIIDGFANLAARRKQF